MITTTTTGPERDADARCAVLDDERDDRRPTQRRPARALDVEAEDRAPRRVALEERRARRVVQVAMAASRLPSARSLA